MKLLTKRDIYTKDEYPQAVKFTDQQLHILWFWDEYNLEKDLQDLHTKLTPAELHGVTEVLKLFTLYELKVGQDYWNGYIAKHFPRPEIQRMAGVFSAVELAVHAPFYSRINEIMGIDTDEFFESYKKEPILSDRMSWLGRRLTKDGTIFDKLKSVGIFSMIEGAILFSSFGFLKHFNNGGKNLLGNLNAGINSSINDETLHSQAGAWLFRQALSEAVDGELLHKSQVEMLYGELIEVAKVIRNHEGVITTKIFEKGAIKGVTHTQLVHFVESRLDHCLEALGIKGIFKPKYNPIADWIYNDIKSSTLHDFFVSQGNDYSRNWKERNFIW